VQRLYDFFRRHPTWVDSFWAVVLLGVSGMSLIAGQENMQGDARLLGIPVVLALSLAVALRRRAPERMLMLIAVVGVFQLVADVRVQPATC
jgi:drug/metabolite transporter (DMT)-like permease